MSFSEYFLLSLIIIFSVPYLLWRLLRLEPHAPLAIVQIIGGVVLGPGVLGAAFPAWHQQVFNPQILLALNGIASWAVMLFVFLAGLEIDLADAWKNKRETGLTAGLALIVPFLFGILIGALMIGYSAGWIGAKGGAVQFVFGVGMACAVTALPILLLLLERLEILRTSFGQRVLRYASLDDVAIWGVLALILLDWERLGRQALFIIAVIPVSMLFRKMMYRIKDSDRWFVMPIWIALCSFAGDWAGLHFMVGAFIGGLVCERSWFMLGRLDQFRNILLLAFMPVFFLTTGLRTQWELGGLSVWLAAIGLLIAATGGKLVGVHIAGQVLLWGPGEASLIGWLLQTKALIMIIFANVLLDKEIISATLFTALLLMAVMSTALTTPFARPLIRNLRLLTKP